MSPDVATSTVVSVLPWPAAKRDISRAHDPGRDVLERERGAMEELECEDPGLDFDQGDRKVERLPDQSVQFRAVDLCAEQSTGQELRHSPQGLLPERVQSACGQGFEDFRNVETAIRGRPFEQSFSQGRRRRSALGADEAQGLRPRCRR